MNYTPKQLQILKLIYQYQTEHGFAPTYAELAKNLSVSTITVFEHLEALERKGAIRRRRHEARSVEIIDALEPVRRQLYTGALGYISATGDMDLNLLIRTGLVLNDSVYVQAGAGIVADSDPGREFEETVHKAHALMETFRVEAPARHCEERSDEAISV